MALRNMISINRMKDIYKLILSLAICQAAGVIGSLFNLSAVPGWYAQLQKPFFSPPSWLFSPVWITLFFLMGISLFLVWRKGFEKNRQAIYWFMAQLFLNAAWSAFFFGLRYPLFAFIEIIFLIAAITITTIKFYKISKAAAYLMAPYLLWAIFAAILNLSIYLLNS